MSSDSVKRDQGLDRTQPITRPAEAPGAEFKAVSSQARAFAQAGKGGKIETAKALRGAAVVKGPRAKEVAQIIDYLNARSRTFNSWIRRSLREGEVFTVRTGYSDDDSFSTNGQKHETIYLNLAQTRNTRYGIPGLVAHEFGHAAGGYSDGKMGTAGPNQYAQARVLAEAGVGDGGVLRYGQDLGGPNTRPVDFVMLG